MHAAATGSSTRAARASDTMSSRPVVDERTSNQASHTRSAAAAAATPCDQAARRAVPTAVAIKRACEGDVEPCPREGVVMGAVV